MITVTQGTFGVFGVKMDTPDVKAIRKLARAYAIPLDAMLIGCINKGIEVIAKQVKDEEAKAELKRLSQGTHTGGESCH